MIAREKFYTPTQLKRGGGKKKVRVKAEGRI
jgi:hypothetical protein